MLSRRRAGAVAALVLLFLAGSTLASVGIAVAQSSHSGSPPTAPSPVPSIGPGQQVLVQGGHDSVVATVPFSGTAPYSWEWLVSANGGQTYARATPAECAVPSGIATTGGTEVSCAFTTSLSTALGTYHFELQVTDSASIPETVNSPVSSTVTVEPAPAAARSPDVASPRFDTDPQEDCTGGCDGNNWFGGTGGSGALVISTASADELLVLEITDSGQSNNGLSTADISDSHGSTWTLESSHDWDGNGHVQYVFYAVDDPTGSDTITVDPDAGTRTTTTTATAVLSAFSSFDTSAPIAALGTFETNTGTQSSASVTTTVAPTTILGVVSTSNGATDFTPTSSPAFTEAGTINDGAATASFLEYYAASATGTYTSEPTWTGSVHWGAEAIAIQGASPLSVTVAPTSQVLDQGQSGTITASASGGTGTLTYTWSIASGSCPGFANSGTATLSYSPSGTTTNCVLTVTVEDSRSATAQPTTPASVTVNSRLTAPSSPTPSAPVLDVNQAETVTGTIPTTGTSTYAWTWLVSVNGGTDVDETHCATNGGTGAAAGATETCAIAANALTAGDTYSFELQVTDSASSPATVTSAASATVTVSSTLLTPATPTLSASKLDVNQALTVTATMPTTGSATYAWTWLIAMNGGSYGTATECATDSGSGAAAGATETCSVASDGLTSGDSYTFEVKVTDSATTPESTTSAASSSVSVDSALGTPGAPSVSATKLDANQALTVTGTIPTSGTATYGWQWLVAIDGGSYGATTQCAVNGGSGAAAGSGVTCAIATDGLTAGDSYTFELQVTDSATSPETVSSSASTSVAVSATLASPATPTLSAAELDANQAETITGTIPTSGTATYSWTWLVSVGGGTYGTETHCATDGGSGAAAGASETCSIAAGALTAGDTYTFELEVTDSATTAETATSTASATLTVNSQLAAPATPTPSGTKLDSNQALTVSGTIPSSGTPSYTWTWLASENGGTYGTASECAVDGGSGAAAGASETCSISAGDLVAGDSYTFELEVTDSASSSETTTSSASATVTVSLQLTAPATPTVSAAALDANQVETVTGTIPTTGTSTYAWTWLVSVGGGSYAAETHCGTDGGSGAVAGATETCTIAAGTLTAGDTYNFELEVTDSATASETTTSSASPSVHVSSALAAPAAPSPSASKLDVDQALTVTALLPTSGTATYAWTWLVSVSGGAYGTATECASDSGSGGAAGATETCSVGSDDLTAGDSYAFEIQVTDSATSAESVTSTASASVVVGSQLTAPAAPSPGATKLDVNQALVVTATLPTSGSATYSWTWLVAMNGGSYGTATECATDSGSGAAAGATETCSVASDAFTAGDSYSFEIQVTDSASNPESVTSSTSASVSVSSALAAPGAPSVSATKLDANQALTVTGTIPTSGTATYGWQWLVAIGSGSYSDATHCASNSGSGASAGATETCAVAANALTAGDSYSFELQVTDSATSPETVSSSASASVAVSATLAPPATPTPSAAALDANQALTVSGSLPSSGSAPYSWTWLLSLNGSAFSTATECAVDGGTGASAGATEVCDLAASTFAGGSTLAFELHVTDGASSPEAVTSGTTATVTVGSELTAPSAPSPSATNIDATEALSVSATIPSNGTPTFAWQWLVSVNGGAYSDATVCGASASGTGAAAGASETCSVPGGSLAGGDTYTFELEVTDSASTAESSTSSASPLVSVSSPLNGGSPTPVGTVLDDGQSVRLSSNPSGGSGGDTYQWYSGATAGACVALGSPISGATSTTYRADPSSTTYYCYVVEDSSGDRAASTAIVVTVNSALTAPAAPAPSATALDVDQILTVTATIPSSGTASYSWQWLVSVNGAAFSGASECAVSSGSGASVGTLESCAISANSLTAGDHYAFELQVTDSATTAETVTSAASSTVGVSTALLPPGAPVVSAGVLDADQAETITGTIPTSGTAPYSWQWWISIDGAAAVGATECSTNSGTGALAGATETCSITGDSLTAGTTYSFELEVEDGSAAGAESELSAASASVTVNAPLTAPSAPTPSTATVSLSGSLTVTGTLPSSGTPTYSWQWWVAANGGAYAKATICASTASGTDGVAGSAVQCTVASGTLTPGSSYTFELQVTDSASLAESVTSPASATVTIAVPALAIGTGQGPVGASYVVTGTGFSASSTVTVSFGSDSLTPTSCSVGTLSGAQITTDTSGQFTCSFTVPAVAAGPYSIVGTDTASSTSTLAFSFTVTTPTITVTPTDGRTGETVTVQGTGFSVSAPLASLVFGGQTISSCATGSLTTNSVGAFNCTFQVPTGVLGSTVRASDAGGMAATATFTVLAPAAAGSSGSTSWLWAVVAAVVVALLLLLVVARRRRSQREESPATGDPAGPPTHSGTPVAALLAAPVSPSPDPVPDGSIPWGGVTLGAAPELSEPVTSVSGPLPIAATPSEAPSDPTPAIPSDTISDLPALHEGAAAEELPTESTPDRPPVRESALEPASEPSIETETSAPEGVTPAAGAFEAQYPPSDTVEPIPEPDLGIPPPPGLDASPEVTPSSVEAPGNFDATPAETPSALPSADPGDLRLPPISTEVSTAAESPAVLEPRAPIDPSSPPTEGTNPTEEPPILSQTVPDDPSSFATPIQGPAATEASAALEPIVPSESTPPPASTEDATTSETPTLPEPTVPADPSSVPTPAEGPAAPLTGVLTSEMSGSLIAEVLAGMIASARAAEPPREGGSSPDSPDGNPILPPMEESAPDSPATHEGTEAGSFESRLGTPSEASPVESEAPSQSAPNPASEDPVNEAVAATEPWTSTELPAAEPDASVPQAGPGVPLAPEPSQAPDPSHPTENPLPELTESAPDPVSPPIALPPPAEIRSTPTTFDPAPAPMPPASAESMGVGDASGVPEAESTTPEFSPAVFGPVEPANPAEMGRTDPPAAPPELPAGSQDPSSPGRLTTGAVAALTLSSILFAPRPVEPALRGTPELPPQYPAEEGRDPAVELSSAGHAQGTGPEPVTELTPTIGPSEPEAPAPDPAPPPEPIRSDAAQPGPAEPAPAAPEPAIAPPEALPTTEPVDSAVVLPIPSLDLGEPEFRPRATPPADPDPDPTTPGVAGSGGSIDSFLWNFEYGGVPLPEDPPRKPTLRRPEDSLDDQNGTKPD